MKNIFTPVLSTFVDFLHCTNIFVLNPHFYYFFVFPSHNMYVAARQLIVRNIAISRMYIIIYNIRFIMNVHVESVELGNRPL